MAYVPHNEADIKRMLETIGVGTVEELFATIPDAYRLAAPPSRLPEAEPEWQVVQRVNGLSRANRDLVCFAGGGVYDHYVPSAVNHLQLRSEWYTAYTPYQPEVAQGTLQLIYEFQSMIAELFDMDIANASMYDCATAAAEATMLAHSVHRDRRGIVVARTLHPHTRRVIETSNAGLQFPYSIVPFGPDGRIDLDHARAHLEGAACLVVQQPNFLGIVEDLASCAAAAHEAGAMLVAAVNPVAMGVLRSPGAQGADVVVAEGINLGNPMSFAGPGLGLFAAKGEYVRQMPGRIAGATVDKQGRRGFVLTLQTREQHIRRDRATSNICTNQSLMALGATVHLALLGRQGLRQVAECCLENAHRAFEAITALDGYAPLVSGPFFNEFAVSTPKPARDIVRLAAEEGLLAGIALDRFSDTFSDREALLIAVTEKRTRAEIGRLVEVLSRA